MKTKSKFKLKLKFPFLEPNKEHCFINKEALVFLANARLHLLDRMQTNIKNTHICS
jgi:hypothetical protein